MDLNSQPLTRQAEALAKVLRLLEHAQEPEKSQVSLALSQCASRLDQLAHTHTTSSDLPRTMRDGIRLGEQATKQLRRETGGGPLHRLGRLFAHNRSDIDPEALASSLLKQLRKQEKALQRLSRQ